MGDSSALLRLDPFGPETVLPAPFFEHRTQTDDVQEGAFADHAPDGGAVVRVEVAVDRDAAGFSEGERFLDRAALEVALAKWLSHNASIV